MAIKTLRVPESAVTIGKNLKSLRISQHFSQNDIARALGVSFQQIQKYEKGQNRLPVEKLFILKNFYNVSYEMFFEGVLGNHNQNQSDNFAYLSFLEIKSCPDPAFQKKLYLAIKALLQ